MLLYKYIEHIYVSILTLIIMNMVYYIAQHTGILKDTEYFYHIFLLMHDVYAYTLYT